MSTQYAGSLSTPQAIIKRLQELEVVGKDFASVAMLFCASAALMLMAAYSLLIPNESSPSDIVPPTLALFTALWWVQFRTLAGRSTPRLRPEGWRLAGLALFVLAACLVPIGEGSLATALFAATLPLIVLAYGRLFHAWLRYLQRRNRLAHTLVEPLKCIPDLFERCLAARDFYARPNPSGPVAGGCGYNPLAVFRPDRLGLVLTGITPGAVVVLAPLLIETLRITEPWNDDAIASLRTRLQRKGQRPVEDLDELERFLDGPSPGWPNSYQTGLGDWG